MMAAAQAPKYAYTIIYCKDVVKSVEFYSKAFGLKVRRQDHSRRWAELDTGSTTLAFTPVVQHETDITGGVQTASKDEPRHNVEISFSYDNVDAAYEHAVESGAVSVAKPEDKEWGQRVGYVRDINGVMIRLGSYVHEPSIPFIQFPA